MLKEHAKLIKVLAEAGEIIGRKKLQKMVFIAKKLSFPFYEKYNFHFFGPYSEELTLKIEELGNLGLIHEVMEKKNGYQQYRYSLTQEGETFLSHHHLDMPSLSDCVNDLNQKSSRFLELVSTVLFFDELPKEQVIEKVFTLKAKQKYTEEDIEQAYEYIHSLQNRTSSCV